MVVNQSVEGDIFGLIQRSEKFLIITHIRPDADAVSSSLAMYWYLIDIGKKASNIDVILPEVSKDLIFIDSENIIKSAPSIDNYDLAIIVDCSDTLRIEGIEHAKKLPTERCIVFDHHERIETTIDAVNFFIDDSASSCTCILYRLFSEFVNAHKEQFCKCVVAGILSDTVFLSLNATEESKRILDACASYANVETIKKQLQLVDERTMFLTELALERFELKGEFGCTYLLQEDLLPNERNLKTVNHKFMIEKILNTKDCSFLILLIENDNKELKASLRTTGANINLNEICEILIDKKFALQGGGHANSAGFRCAINGDISECLQNTFEVVINEIAEKRK